MNTQAFIGDLRRCVVGRIQLSTDAFRPYVDAVERAFGSEIDYAQIMKSYALTIRMQLRRFTRLTNGFSKKLANLKAMVAL